jgi:hypothetical protein
MPGKFDRNSFFSPVKIPTSGKLRKTVNRQFQSNKAGKVAQKSCPVIPSGQLIIIGRGE